jgi:striatin 1/3/4
LSNNASQAVPPTKLAAIQAQTGSGNGGSQKDDGSHKDGSGGSSPRSEGMTSLPANKRVGLRHKIRLAITLSFDAKWRTYDSS